jgi:hypothetical protein
MQTTDTHIGECPLCGHSAVIVEDYENKEIVVLCPDRFCMNCPERYEL